MPVELVKTVAALHDDARFWVLGGGDPVDPISARDGRDV